MEGNIIEQLKAAANAPEVSMEEYKAERLSEERRGYSEPTPERIEKKVTENVSEPEEHIEKEEKPYRPWEEESEKKSETEDEEDDDVIVTDNDKKVPLQKLLKIKAQKKEREAELMAYKAKIAEYEETIRKTLPKEEAEVITDPYEHKLKTLKEPDPKDYDTWESYKSANDEYKSKVREVEEERIAARVEKSFVDKIQNEKAREEEAKRVQSFVDKIEESSKKNPEIKSAIGWFEKKMIENGGPGRALDPIVQRALVSDDNSPELIHRVVQDKNLIEDIFSKGDSASILKRIGKLSAYLELENDKDEDNGSSYTPTPKKIIPKTVSGYSASGSKPSDKADTLEEYKKLRAKEERERQKNRR